MKLAPFLLRRSPGLFFLAAVMGISSGLCSTALLALINAVLNAETLKVAGDPLLLFVALCLLLPATQVVSEHLLVRIGENSVREMRLNLSRRILASPLSQLEKLGAHRLLVTLSHDVEVVSRSVGLIPVVFIGGALILSCFVYLIWLSFQLVPVLVGGLLLGTACYQLPLLAANRQLLSARKQRDHLYGHFKGLTEGVKELKLNRRRRQAFLSLLDDTSERLRSSNIAAMTIFSGGRGLGLTVVFAAIGLLVFRLFGFDQLPRQTVTGYILVLLFMLRPLQGILAVIPEFGRAGIALEQVHRIGLSLLAEQGAETREAREEPRWNGLELTGVTYRHRSNQSQDAFRLGALDLTLEPGEIVFLVGGNGSGKTTLAKLVLGLYIPEEGTVRLDGEVIETPEDFDRYRQNFAAVFADFYLFESLLGLERPDLDRDARDYLALLQLDRKVEIRDGALSTLELSQGQRKRLALLTAYLEDRPIYVFDEWAAEQDPHFRQIFYRQMLPELRNRGKAVLVISHDDRYYDVADRIVKLDYGQLVYDGRAADLPGLTALV